jgi:hypothetical protein
MRWLGESCCFLSWRADCRPHHGHVLAMQPLSSADEALWWLAGSASVCTLATHHPCHLPAPTVIKRVPSLPRASEVFSPSTGVTKTAYYLADPPQLPVKFLIKDQARAPLFANPNAYPNRQQ